MIRTLLFKPCISSCNVVIRLKNGQFSTLIPTKCRKFIEHTASASLTYFSTLHEVATLTLRYERQMTMPDTLRLNLFFDGQKIIFSRLPVPMLGDTGEYTFQQLKSSSTIGKMLMATHPELFSN